MSLRGATILVGDNALTLLEAIAVALAAAAGRGTPGIYARGKAFDAELLGGLRKLRLAIYGGGIVDPMGLFGNFSNLASARRTSPAAKPGRRGR